MNIAILSHLKYPIAPPFAGGLESFTHLFCRELISRGHQVTLFASAESDPELGLYPILPQSSIAATAHLPPTEVPDALRAIEYPAFSRAISMIKQSSFDLVHNHTLSPFLLTNGHRLGLPFVSTLHIPPSEPYRISSHGKEARNHRIVAISKANREAWQSYVGQQTLIPNGTEMPPTSNIPNSASEPSAFWFGRIHPDKGLPLAIRAAAIAQLPLRIAGPIADAAYFEKEVAPLLSTKTTYLGHLTHDQIRAELHAAAVTLISPIWPEPFGLVVAESLAAGTPVAAFATGAVPELLSTETGRLAIPGDPASLATAAIDCLRLAPSSCRKRANTYFSASLMMDRYIALYDEMLEAKVSKNSPPEPIA